MVFVITKKQIIHKHGIHLVISKRFNTGHLQEESPGKRQALLTVVPGEYTDDDITPISFYPSSLIVFLPLTVCMLSCICMLTWKSLYNRDE